MSHRSRSQVREPALAEKIRFWLGGSLPDVFGPWVLDRVQSKWFPLRRMGSVLATAVTVFGIALVSGRSRTHLLMAASLPILAGLVVMFVLQNRMRRRELARYQNPRRTDGSDAVYDANGKSFS